MDVGCLQVAVKWRENTESYIPECLLIQQLLRISFTKEKN